MDVFKDKNTTKKKVVFFKTHQIFHYKLFANLFAYSKIINNLVNQANKKDRDVIFSNYHNPILSLRIEEQIIPDGCDKR